MSIRTQITLPDSQYAYLKRESERTGSSLAELVRRALSLAYDLREPKKPTKAQLVKRQRIIKESAGLWADRDFTTEEYIRSIRGQGLGEKLDELGL